MCLGAIGDVLSNEASHTANLFGQIGDDPEALLAPDPLMAGAARTLTGDKNFQPLVGQLGGETGKQFSESKAQGVDTAPSQTLGQIANVVALAAGTYGLASGGAGSAAGLGGDAGAGASAAAPSAAGAAGGDTAGLAAADSAAVDAEGAAPGLTEGGTAASSGGAGAGAGSSTGSSAWMDYGKTAAKVLAPAVLSSLLAPKPPKAAPVAAMPDPLAQQQAQQQKIIDQMARRGRASTILTNPGAASGGSLGG